MCMLRVYLRGLADDFWVHLFVTILTFPVGVKPLQSSNGYANCNPDASCWLCYQCMSRHMYYVFWMSMSRLKVLQYYSKASVLCSPCLVWDPNAKNSLCQRVCRAEIQWNYASCLQSHQLAALDQRGQRYFSEMMGFVFSIFYMLISCDLESIFVIILI
jgi:hypothetical protein